MSLASCSLFGTVSLTASALDILRKEKSDLSKVIFSKLIEIGRYSSKYMIPGASVSYGRSVFTARNHPKGFENTGHSGSSRWMKMQHYGYWKLFYVIFPAAGGEVDDGDRRLESRGEDRKW